MENKTLEELKAEIAAEEAVNTDTKKGETIENVETDEPAEAESQEPNESEPVEAWLSEEAEDSQYNSEGGGFVPNAAAKALRLKNKALKKEKNQEIEDLKQRLEAFENAAKPQVATQDSPPTLEECGWDEGKYDEAMRQYYQSSTENIVKSNIEQQQASASKQAAQNAASLRQEQAIGNHYNRAANLISKTEGLTEEMYSNADGVIRHSLEQAFPSMGDQLAEKLIASLSETGEGSEKAWLYLGRNGTKVRELVSTLTDDPSGIKAAMMLGELKARATKPIRQKSNAPNPAPNLKGDKAAVTTSKKEYDASSDISTRIAIKRAAKAAGQDVSQW